MWKYYNILFLLILIAIFLSCTNSPEKQTVETSVIQYADTSRNTPIYHRSFRNEDSIQIVKYIDTLNYQLYVELSEESEKKAKSKASIKIFLDSIRISYDQGDVLYNADSSFKVYFIYGEGCGAYCHRFHESFIHWGKAYRNKTSIKLEPITRVYKITDNKEVEYLIFQENTVRAGAARLETNFQATLISLGKDTILIHPFINEGKRESHLSIVLDEQPDQESLVYVPEEIKLKFFNLKMEEGNLQQGEYIFKNGNFYLSKVSIQGYPETDDQDGP